MDNIVEICEELPSRSGSRPAAYIIEHEASGKLYIGSTGDAAQRKRCHLSDLRHGTNSNKALQAAFNDDPGLKFTFILTQDREAAYDFEQKLIDHHKGDERLCNAAPDARVSGKGMTRSEETCRRISEAQIGRSSPLKGRTLSAEHREKIADSRKELYTPVSVNGAEYPSLSAAAQALGTSPTTVRKRVMSGTERFSNYFYIEG